MSKQMLDLADRITNHLVTLASTNMKLSLTEWDIISNDILSAVATLRSSAVSAPFGLDEAEYKREKAMAEWQDSLVPATVPQAAPTREEVAKIVVKSMRGAADPEIYGTSHAERMNEITADKAADAIILLFGRSQAVCEVDPADLWDRYCKETPKSGRTPQGAMAFAVDALSRPER